MFVVNIAGDMYQITVRWTEYAPRVVDIHPELFAEMKGLIYSTLQLKLPFTLIKSLTVSWTKNGYVAPVKIFLFRCSTAKVSHFRSADVGKDGLLSIAYPTTRFANLLLRPDCPSRFTTAKSKFSVHFPLVMTSSNPLIKFDWPYCFQVQCWKGKSAQLTWDDFLGNEVLTFVLVTHLSGFGANIDSKRIFWIVTRAFWKCRHVI